MKKKKVLATIIASAMVLCGCGSLETEAKEYTEDYGVFLSLEYDDLPADANYETIVVDAQYFSADEIDALKENNGSVYSYLNVGSIENFRDYFEEYEDITLAPYENWDEEYWIDVSKESWQSFIVDELAPSLIEKGIDGFFIDNTDVYYNFEEEEIYQGLVNILSQLKDTDMKVLINGGDVFVTKYLEENGNLDDILDGVNQESVFTSINWDEGTFTSSDEESKEYYLSYLEKVKAAGKEIYLLEYTDDESMILNIKNQCTRRYYHYYISNSIELD